MEDVSWLYDLRPVNFFYKKDESNHKEYGLIAEEVELVNKLFVSYDDEGEIQDLEPYIWRYLLLRTDRLEARVRIAKAIQYQNHT